MDKFVYFLGFGIVKSGLWFQLVCYFKSKVRESFGGFLREDFWRLFLYQFKGRVDFRVFRLLVFRGGRRVIRLVLVCFRVQLGEFQSYRVFEIQCVYVKERGWGFSGGRVRIVYFRIFNLGVSVFDFRFFQFFRVRRVIYDFSESLRFIACFCSQFFIFEMFCREIVIV